MADGPALTPEQTKRVIQIAMDLAREGRGDELAEFLDHGLPVDVADADANTLLMLASYHGRGDTVAMLIARGADVDLRNNRDQCPLAGALFKGEDDVARHLVAAGADLDAGSPTARQAAELFGRSHLLE
ncbi:MAG: ankyrin repeat domain-containing protein [Cumulibacter sp.]